MKVLHFSSVLSLVSAFFMSAQTGFAASKPAPAPVPPAQASPATLSGASGEWSYRCVYFAGAPDASPVLCIAEQKLMMENAQKESASLGAVILAKATTDPIKTPLTKRPWRLTLMTPLGVSLQKNVHLVIGKSTPITATWQSCVQSGCLASADLTSEQTALIRHGQTGHIEVGKLNGGILTINFSMTGIETSFKTLDNWMIRP